MTKMWANLSTAYPGVTLRVMQGHDMEFSYRVYASSRAEEMARLVDWSEARKGEFLRFQFTAQHTHYQTHYPAARYDVIVRDGEDIGRLYVARLHGEIRLMDIALLSEHRNQGIGHALVKELLDEAADDGKPVTLHVEERNPAKRLYERLGFDEVGEETFYKRMCWAPPGRELPRVADSRRRETGLR